MSGVGGVLQDPNPEKIRNFDEKAVGKTQKAVGKTKKPLNLAVDSRYPPPYPRWVGGLPQVGGWSEVPIQKTVIGVGKSVNLPTLG